MNWIHRLASLAVAAVLLLAAGLALAAGPDVKVVKKEGIGSILADARGKTLYVYRKDVRGRSSCAGPCVEKWPVFFRETIVAPEGLSASEFATITRADGKQQTTYVGRPLYYFAGDGFAGDTNGHGFNESWYVATP